jgi:hypothetical protein
MLLVIASISLVGSQRCSALPLNFITPTLYSFFIASRAKSMVPCLAWSIFFPFMLPEQSRRTYILPHLTAKLEATGFSEAEIFIPPSTIETYLFPAACDIWMPVLFSLSMLFPPFNPGPYGIIQRHYATGVK